jgi:DNA-binding transcriptional regulator YbjK
MAPLKGTIDSSGPPKARLSSEAVLSAALELVDAEGLEALAMRRLGQELGRGP